MKKKILNINLGRRDAAGSLHSPEASEGGEVALSTFKKLATLVILLCILCVKSSSAQSLYNSGDTISITNGTTLYINGGMQNALNGIIVPVIQNNGGLNITGDLNNVAGTRYSGTGLFQMSGNGAQSFSGANFYDIRVTGSGVKQMIGASHLKDSLVFTAGSINTALTKDTIYMDSTAGIKELAGSELIGNLKYQKYLQKNTTYTFGGQGLSINAAGAAPGLTTIIRVTGDSGIQRKPMATSTERFFQVIPTNNSGLNATLIFYYLDAELNGLSESDLQLFKSIDKGKSWITEGYVTRSATNDYLTLTGVNSFGRFTAGSITHPLPVELLYFNAKLQTQQSSLLDWETASELNSNRFDIERSDDGYNFEKIGEEKAQGTTNERHKYTYTDNFGITTAAILYYRLREVDGNGEFMYSDIRRVKLQQDAVEFKAWYNAETNKTEALLSNSKEIKGVLRMIDIQGKLIGEQNISLPAGTAKVQLDMTGLSQGIYTLYYSSESEVQVKRVMKY